MPILQVKLLSDDARMPTKNLITDAGFDLYAAEETYIDNPGPYSIPLDIAVSAPMGYYYTMEGRSSLSTHNLFPFRAIIDATYTGPLFVVLFNLKQNNYMIKKHDRIAQLVVHKVYETQLMAVAEFSAEYDVRGQAGWGSSGR